MANHTQFGRKALWFDTLVGSLKRRVSMACNGSIHRTNYNVTHIKLEVIPFPHISDKTQRVQGELIIVQIFEYE